LSACTSACTDSWQIVDCDPNLARIVTAWPTLAEPMKQAMLALTQSG